MSPKGPIVGPEGPHHCNQRLQPSAGARKSRPLGGNFSSIYKKKNHKQMKLKKKEILLTILYHTNTVHSGFHTTLNCDETNILQNFFFYCMFFIGDKIGCHQKNVQDIERTIVKAYLSFPGC